MVDESKKSSKGPGDWLSFMGMPRQPKIVTRLVGLGTAIALVSLLFLGVSWFALTRQTLQREVQRQHEELTRRVASEISAVLERVLADLTLWVEIQNPMTAPAGHDLVDLRRPLALNTQLDGLTLLDRQGHEIGKVNRYHTFLPSELGERSQEAEFQRALAGEQVIGTVQQSPYSTEPVTTLWMPVRTGETGEVAGVLAAEVNLHQILSSLRSVDVGDEAIIYLVDSSGWLLDYTGGSKLLQRQNLSHLPGVEAFLNRRPITGEFKGLTGEQVVGAWTALEESGWGVIVEILSRRVLEDMDQLAMVFYGSLLGAMLMSTLAMDLFARRLVQPLLRLKQGAEAIEQGNLDYTIDIKTGDEVESLAVQFNQMARSLRVSRAEIEARAQELEQRVKERTQALAHRSVQLETAAHVSEAAGSILDLGELEQHLVELIRQRFEYYYVGLFLIDESGEWAGEPGRWAVLRAGTGEAGQAMLEAGHKLEVGGASMIGWCVANAQARIALDVGEEAVRFDNPLLPETRSEMALPLITRGQVIGALTVQSEREAAFSKEDISILQTMVTQVSNAIQNARLFESERAQLRLAQTLQEVGALLTTRMNLDEVFERIFDLLAQVVEYDSVSVQLLAEDGSMYLGSARGFPDIELARQMVSTIAAQTLEERWGQQRMMVISDTYANEGWVVAPGFEYIRSWIGAALVVKGRMLGILNVDSATVNAYNAAMGETIAAFANQAAVAIENARLYEQTQRRSMQLQTAAEVSRAATSVLDMDELLSISVNLIHDRFDLYYAGLFLVDEAGEFAVLRAGTGEAGRQMLAQGHKLAVGGRSMIGWCVANTQSRIALDAAEDTVRFVNPLLPETRSEMALPLSSRGQVIGAMTIQSTEKAAFSESDVSVLQAMADQVANAIANVSLLEAEQRRRQAATALQEASMALSGLLEPEQVYQETLVQLARIAPYDSAAVFIYDEAARVARPVAARGMPPNVLEEMLHSTSFNLHVDDDLLFLEGIETGRPVILDDAQADDRFFKAEGTAYIRGWMGVPMLVGDRTIGLLTLDSHQVGAFDEDMSLQAATFAAQAGLAIENARLFQETQASLQEITRLHRRYLQEQWEEFLGEEKTQQRAGYLFDQQEVQAAGDLWRPEIEMAVARGRTLALRADDKEWADGDGDAKSALVVPLQLRGQIIGALDFFEQEGDRQWSEDDIALVEAVADQVALAVENARAYEELQRTAIELQEMDRLKSQFLANMSHELRTPLNSIIGFSRVMLKDIDGPLTDLQRTDLTSIYNNGQHLLGLINDVLDLSRIEAGKMELIFEPLDLHPLIDSVMSTAIGLVKDKAVNLVKEVADDLPVIRADSTRIRQVILNLISNAAKFTEEGSITVRAWADDSWVTVSVADTGGGIPKDQWEKIFREFEQVDGSPTRRVGGTGLGLPISRHFVELHGGRIWVESEMGVGSTFIFTIPIHGPGYIEAPELAALEIDPDRRLVLAVESDEGMVALYQRYLERHGYQVVGLSDAERVPLWARELSPFAVLMDVILPQADGWALLEKLKTSRETAHVPVIVCSVADETARGLSMGAAAYLTKPVLEEDLLQAMALVAKLQYA